VFDVFDLQPIESSILYDDDKLIEYLANVFDADGGYMNCSLDSLGYGKSETPILLFTGYNKNSYN
jgi:hypothetical protein